MPIDPTTTNLEGKDYSNRDLRGITLAYHRCMRASFAGADLRGVSFIEADCTDANFTGAMLDGCDFTRAVVTPEQLATAKSAEKLITASGNHQVAPAASAPVVTPAESGAPVLWQLEESNNSLAQENAVLRARVELLDSDNKHLYTQLEDALAEIRRLTTPESDASALLMEEDRPAPARRGKAQA